MQIGNEQASNPRVHHQSVNGGSVELWKGTSGSTWLYEGPQLRHWLEGM